MRRKTELFTGVFTGGRLNSHPLSRGTVSLALCRKCNLCGSGTGESARLVCVDRSRGGRPLPGRGPHAMPRYLRSALVVSFETLSHRHAHRTGTVALVLADTCQSHAAGILLFRLPQTTFHTADSRRRLFPDKIWIHAPRITIQLPRPPQRPRTPRQPSRHTKKLQSLSVSGYPIERNMSVQKTSHFTLKNPFPRRTVRFTRVFTTYYM